MSRTTPLNASGEKVCVNVGESSDITLTMDDMAGTQLTKAQLVTLTATLVNAADGAVINSRNGQDIKDANQGTVTTAGALTLKLGPLDNINAGSTAVGVIEKHYLLITWTWVDSDAVTRTGSTELVLHVRPTTTPVP